MANILNVGPIVPVDKGVYSSATTYSILNLVDDGTGQVYLSKKNNNLGNSLTNGEWWGRYTGPQGPQGVKGDTGTINLAGEYGTSESVGLNQKFLTEKMAGFEEVVQTQLITTPPATLNTQVGYYYCMGGSGVVVDTMTIQLPAIADYEESKAKNVSFFMIMGSAPAVTFVSAGAERIRYQKDFALEAERGYEVNALWNSHAWVIAAVEIEIPETKVVAKVNVTNTSGTTSILGNTSNISAVEIDGVEQQSVETGYTFSTTGEHTVKYTLTDPTSIGNSAFSSCSGLTSVTIPDSVTSIGNSAFGWCYGLTSITIPDSVTSIGVDAFRGCKGLTSITIGSGVTSIGGSAFNSCTGLTSITIPSSVTSIGEYAFNGCSGLTNIVVDSGNTVYDSRDNCNAIINTSTNELIKGCNNTVIPNSVTSIGGWAFKGCTGLTSITIPNTVTSIGNSAFNGCTGLTSITIPSSVTSIGRSTFNGCSGLTNIVVDSANTVFDSRDNCNAIVKTSTNELIAGCNNTVIPNSVTSIGDSAFNKCTGLTSITIPDSVTSIDGEAFRDCENLTTITSLAAKAPTIQSDTFQNVKTGGTLRVPSGSTGYDEWMSYLDMYDWTMMPMNIITYEATAKLTETTSKWSSGLHTDAFSGKSGQLTMTSHTFENGVGTIEFDGDVTTVGNNAFDGCTGLTNVTIPDSVTSIGNSAFNGCRGLTSITIPNSVTNIGNNAFYSCKGLTSITIPDSVTSIGEWAFYSCKGLTSITIPDSVTSIDDQAFNNCTGLISITIPDSIISIGDFAFSNCEGLTSVSIPDSVTSIGVYAFNGCRGLTSITIPNTVTSIGNSAFNGCTGLTSITIPSSVTSIGRSTFNGCSGLTNIVVDSANTVFDSRDNCNAIINTSTNELITGCKNTVIPNTVTSIGDNAFSGCNSLTSINIPDSVTSIGNSAFYGCEGLTSIVVNSANTVFDSRDNCNAIIKTSTNELIAGCKNTVIPNTVTSIGNFAFNGCTGLTSITIPDSVTSIGWDAFGNCENLTSITSLATTAPTIDSATFDRVKTGGTLRVPIGSTGYDEWMSYLDMYGWTKVEQ